MLSEFFRRLKYRYVHMHLNTRFLLIIALSVFVPLSISLWQFNEYASDVASQRRIESLKTSYSQAYTYFRDTFEDIRKDASLCLLDENFRSLMQPKSIPLSADTQRGLKDEIGLTVDFIERNSEDVNLNIYVPDLYSYMVDNQDFFSFGAIAQSPWYRDLTRNPYRNKWITSDEYEFDFTSTLATTGTGRADLLSYAVRMCDLEDYSRTIAIFRVDIQKAHVENTLRQCLVTGSGSAFLLSGEHVVASYAYGDDLVLPSDRVSLPYTEEVTTYETIGAERYLVMYRSFKQTPWVFGIAVPVEEGASLLNVSQWYSFLIIALACGIAIFIVSLQYTNFAAMRIRAVSEKMKDMRLGKFERIQRTRPADEISELVDSYNYMVDEVQLLVRNEYLLGASRRDAELKALQSQINPHFLYNTLELINYYAFQSEPKTVERIVSLLAKFYKISLNRGRDRCHIWQELELTRTFFDIQNMRFNSEFTLTIDVPADLYQIEIPKITLQPLVENSIQYGILRKEIRSGGVTIRAHRSNSTVRITVSDDGVGMPEDVVHRLNRNEELVSGEDEDYGSRYGIRSISERLKACFGEESSLSFQSEQGSGTTVTIEFHLDEQGAVLED